MNNAKDELRKKAEAMLGKSGTEVAQMSDDAIQQLLYEFQVYQIELELQNEELKNSQHELIVSRNRYFHLYNSSPTGYLTLNAAGLIQAANPAAEKLLGAACNADLMNKKLGQFINPSDQDSYYFFIQDVLSKRTEQRLITRLKQSSAKSTPLDCLGFNYRVCLPEACIFNDGFIHLEFRGIYGINENDDTQICLSIFDITETRKAHQTIACLNEELEQKVLQQTRALSETNQDLIKKIEQLKIYKQQLTEREVKLNAIFNAAVEGIITIDLFGVIISVNNAVESIFGYSKEELLNHNITKLIPLAQHKNHLQHLKNYSDSGLSSVIGNIREVTGVRKDGSDVPLDISIAQYSIDGTNYLTSIVRDVSARKLQEQRDQEHVDELAHVTRLGLMGELASGIAHEVNQPLTAITSYSQACLNYIQDENIDRAKLSDILYKTNQQALRAGQIIHRMRDFVKSKKLRHSSIDFNNLIHDALGLCESYLKQNNIVLRLQLAEDLPELFVDSIQIEQVILNLIRNSIDALTNLPQLKPRILSIQTSINKNNDIEIRIKDNGPGIDASEQKKIFTPFFTTKSDGMGMGLAICRSIIDAHEGALRFNSHLNKGTTFYFTLPVRRQTNGI